MTVSRSRTLWIALAVAAVFGGIALMPGADPGSSTVGISEVEAAGSPNLFWLSQRETPALASIKATAKTGTPAVGGPSANVGQVIQLKGAALAPGVASFAGYNGTPVTSPLTNVKVGKKGKVAVPPLAVTGDVSVIPDGGEQSDSLPLQIVPTISSLSSKTVAAGSDLTIEGTGFDTTVHVLVPGVPDPVEPSEFDADTVVFTVPASARKGKIMVVTEGGMSNGSKIKVTAAATPTKRLAVDPATGLILVTDDIANTLSALDPATGNVVHSVALGLEPDALRLSSDQTEAVVLDDSGAAVRVDLATWSVRDGKPQDGFFAVRSSVDVEYWPDLLKVDPKIEAFTIAAARVYALDNDRGMLFVLDDTGLAPIAVYRYEGPVDGLAIGNDGLVYTIDRATGRLLSVRIED